MFQVKLCCEKHRLPLYANYCFMVLLFPKALWAAYWSHNVTENLERSLGLRVYKIYICKRCMYKCSLHVPGTLYIPSCIAEVCPVPKSEWSRDAQFVCCKKLSWRELAYSVWCGNGSGMTGGSRLTLRICLLRLRRPTRPAQAATLW